MRSVIVYGFIYQTSGPARGVYPHCALALSVRRVGETVNRRRALVRWILGAAWGLTLQGHEGVVSHFLCCMLRHLREGNVSIHRAEKLHL